LTFCDLSVKNNHINEQQIKEQTNKQTNKQAKCHRFSTIPNKESRDLNQLKESFWFVFDNLCEKVKITNKQTNKQTNEQTNKEANEQTYR
jgi:hypothetical protein